MGRTGNLATPEQLSILGGEWNAGKASAPHPAATHQLRRIDVSTASEYVPSQQK